MSTESPGAASTDPSERLAIAIQNEPIAHVSLSGTLDTITTEYFDAFTRCGVPTHRGWLLIDAAHLELLTSSGAGALIRTASRAADTGGGIILVCPPGQVRDVIRFMRLDMVIDTVDSIDQAISFLNAQLTTEPTT